MWRDFVNSNGKLDVGKVAGALGAVLFLACLVAVFCGRSAAITAQSCEAALAKVAAPKARDDEGALRIAGFWPPKISIGQRFCVAVAGVAAASQSKALQQDIDRSQRKFEESASVSDGADKSAQEARGFYNAAETALAGNPQHADLKTRKAEAQQALGTAEQAAADARAALKKNADEHKAALAAKDQGLTPIDIQLYLDSHPADHLKIKALAVPEIQYLLFDLAAASDANAGEAVFWRALFSGGRELRVTKTISVGVSRGAVIGASVPQRTADGELKFKILNLWAVVPGALALLLLTFSLASLAANSTMLRDNGNRTGIDAADRAGKAAAQAALDEAKLAVENAERDKAQAALAAKPGDLALTAALDKAALAALAAQKQLNDTRAVLVHAEVDKAVKDDDERPTGPYSLARVAMALWFVLSLAGFVFIWLTTGQFRNVMTTDVLVLLGIQGSTTLASITLINDPGAKSSKTKSFLTDILSADGGQKLHRIQMAAWTVILAVIFIWNVVWGFSFSAAKFDANLLLLMGITNLTYLGFKTQEVK